MGWFGWLRRSGDGEDPRLREWRAAWTDAADTPQETTAAALRERLDTIAATANPDDVEIEREMLDGLDATVELTRALTQGPPPAIVTGHRAVGADTCHFSAPASLPDDPAQPAGTLLITSARLLFVGGARSLAVPWHAVTDAGRQDRDLLVARAGAGEVQRVRFNSFGDALQALTLARHLRRRRV